MTASIAGPDWDLTPYFSALGADDYEVFRDDLLCDLDGLQRRVADLPAVADSVSGWAEFLGKLARSRVGCVHMGRVGAHPRK